ncbi:hypothetical protein E2C01_010342 [Portunus trituberculatus]|uniref:Uncharacterized protein n=1 Tax=Portunus trituberculatus TaxID=210409 RepID=A0A5B7D876_PORTR|nr:hypothetical protein [Portunus trituberculatus]
MVSSQHEELSGGLELLGKEVCHHLEAKTRPDNSTSTTLHYITTPAWTHLYAILPTVHIVTKEQEVGGCEVRPNPPQCLLKADQVSCNAGLSFLLCSKKRRAATISLGRDLVLKASTERYLSKCLAGFSADTSAVVNTDASFVFSTSKPVSDTSPAPRKHRLTFHVEQQLCVNDLSRASHLHSVLSEGVPTVAWALERSITQRNGGCNEFLGEPVWWVGGEVLQSRLILFSPLVEP